MFDVFISIDCIFSTVKPIDDSYKTIKAKGKGEYKSKGSKFFSYAYRVNTLEDIKSQLEDIKKEHFKSRHVCYAYRLDVAGTQFRANDDGEPSGTAGLPILNVLKSNQLVKTLIAVVRYFGGTKLGVPGLITAYKTAAQDAIQHTDIQEEYIIDQVKLEFKYDQLGTLMNIVAASPFKIIDQSYDEHPFLVLTCRHSQTEPNIVSLYSKILGYDISDLDIVKDLEIKYTLLQQKEGLL